MRKAYVFWAVGGSVVVAGFLACAGGSSGGTPTQQQLLRVNVRVTCGANQISINVPDSIIVEPGQDVQWHLIPSANPNAPGVQDIIVITPKQGNRWVFTNDIEGTRRENNPAVGQDAQGEEGVYGYSIRAQCTRGNRPPMEITLDPDLILDDPGTPPDSIPN